MCKQLRVVEGDSLKREINMRRHIVSMLPNKDNFSGTNQNSWVNEHGGVWGLRYNRMASPFSITGRVVWYMSINAQERLKWAP